MHKTYVFILWLHILFDEDGVILEDKCIIQLLLSDDIAFLGRDSQYTEDIQEAVIFKSMLEAQLYIEKNRLDRISKIRKIMYSSDTI